jgi:hypothetical protein
VPRAQDEVAVFLVVVPLDDPKPQWAHNMTTPGALAALAICDGRRGSRDRHRDGAAARDGREETD